MAEFVQQVDVDEIPLSRVLAVLWHHKLTITGAILLGAASGLALSYFVEPEYRAEIVVVPASDDADSALTGLGGQLGGLASLAGIKLVSGGTKNETLEYLSSRAFTGDFLRRHEGIPVLFADRWDPATASWDEARAPTLNAAVRRFDRRVRAVVEDRQTGAITISVTLRDREVAARWANELIADLNRQLRQRAISDARRSIGFLQQELARTELLDVRQAIGRLLETQFRTIMLANVRDEYALRIIDPAVPPDAVDRVRPMRALYAIVGAMLGALLAGAFFLVRDLGGRRIGAG